MQSRDRGRDVRVVPILIAGFIACMRACLRCAGPGCGAVRRAVAKAQRLAPVGLPSLTGSPSPTALEGAQGFAACGRWPDRSVRWRVRLRLHRSMQKLDGLAVPTWMSSAAHSRDQGSRALFLHSARERACLTNRPRPGAWLHFCSQCLDVLSGSVFSSS
jgi:hypothetical protein